MKTVHGYEILRYERVGDDEAAVLAYRGTDTIHPYVVWTLAREVYTCGYYTDSLQKARQAFSDRLRFYDVGQPTGGR